MILRFLSRQIASISISKVEYVDRLLIRKYLNKTLIDLSEIIEGRESGRDSRQET